MPDLTADGRRFVIHPQEQSRRQIWPVPPVPFSTDNRVDEAALDALVDFYLQAGVDGLFTLAYSGEAFELSDDERIAVCRRVIDRCAGRTKVVAAGNFEGDLVQQIKQLNRIAATGPDAVIVLLSTLPDPTAIVEDLKTIAHHVQIPLGVYECPVPEHRLLSPADVKVLAETGRYVFLKETSRDRKTYRAKLLAAAGSPLQIFQANWAQLPGSLEDGCPGFCGIIANVFPELTDVFCNDENLSPREREHLFLALSTVLERIVERNYPASMKYVLSLRNLTLSTRSRMAGVKDIDRFDMERLTEVLELPLWQKLPRRLLQLLSRDGAGNALGHKKRPHGTDKDGSPHSRTFQTHGYE